MKVFLAEVGNGFQKVVFFFEKAFFSEFETLNGLVGLKVQYLSALEINKKFLFLFSLILESGLGAVQFIPNLLVKDLVLLILVDFSLLLRDQLLFLLHFHLKSCDLLIQISDSFVLQIKAVLQLMNSQRLRKDQRQVVAVMDVVKFEFLLQTVVNLFL